MAISRQSRLLRLPRELRDWIVGEVLLTPRRELETVDDFRDSLREGRFRTGYGNRIKWDSLVAPAGPLLLTNQQLNSETRDFIRRRRAETSRYVVDIAYLKNCTFWATWLMQPVVQPHVDEIYIQWRILDCPDQLGLVPESGDTRVWNPRAAMFQASEQVGGALAIEIALSGLVVGEILGRDRGPTVGRLVFDFLPATDRHILPLGPYWDQKHGWRDFFEIYYNCYSAKPQKDDPPKHYLGLRAAAALAGFTADCLESPPPSLWSTGVLQRRVTELVIRVAGKTVDRRTWKATPTTTDNE